MLLNLCFHMAMTSAVFAGGITLTNYQLVCQAVRGEGAAVGAGELQDQSRQPRQQGGTGEEKGDTY